MLLTAMLKREMQKELDSIQVEINEGESAQYRKYRALSDSIGIDVYSIEHFITSDDTQGMLHVDFINTLFERYRDKIINPIKSSTTFALDSGEGIPIEWGERIEE